jgi:hypothetical protein
MNIQSTLRGVDKDLHTIAFSTSHVSNNSAFRLTLVLTNLFIGGRRGWGNGLSAIECKNVT